MTEAHAEKLVAMCALSVSSRINVSNITFGLTVHLSFIWLLIRVSLSL